MTGKFNVGEADIEIISFSNKWNNGLTFCNVCAVVNNNKKCEYSGLNGKTILEGFTMQGSKCTIMLCIDFLFLCSCMFHQQTFRRHGQRQEEFRKMTGLNGCEGSV